VTKNTPFELYSTGLPDGRRVVSIVASEPERVTLWICSTSPNDALDRAHAFGAAGCRVVKWFRPLGAAVEAAGRDPDGGVFRPDVHSARNDGFRPLAAFSDYFRRAH
jgi:hypothetical protein